MSPIQATTQIYSPGTSQFPPLVKTLGAFCVSRSITAYLVGGVVRDAVLARTTRDIDLVVDLPATRLGREMADTIGGKLVVLDENREIVRIVMPGTDGISTIDIATAKDGIDNDLKRRDFTLDAIAVSLSELCEEPGQVRLVDPFNGVADIHDTTIRAVSPSVFRDDPARLLRGPRLAAQLRFTIDEDTAQWIRQDAQLTTTVAPERLRDEILKLLAEPGATASLRLLDGLGLLCRVIPELNLARGVTQPREHYWDVLDHCIETAAKVEKLVQCRSQVDDLVQCVPWSEDLEAYFAQEASDGHTRLTLLKLAGLLHDVSKPDSRTVEASGRIRFLGHQTMGARVVEQVMDRLRFSRRGITLVSRMVEHHLRPSQMAQDGETPSRKAMYRYYRDLGDAAIDTLFLNLADYLAARGPELQSEEWVEHCRVIGHILRGGTVGETQESMPKLIDGNDIMEFFTIGPGPQVGLLLTKVHEAQAGGEIATREEALGLVESCLRLGDSVA